MAHKCNLIIQTLSTLSLVAKIEDYLLICTPITAKALGAHQIS